MPEGSHLKRLSQSRGSPWAWLGSRRASSDHQQESYPGQLLEALLADEVEFVVIGGFAAVAHGSTRPTAILDIAYSRDRHSVARLARFLVSLDACLRRDPSRPFILHADLREGFNFRLNTDLGFLDIVGQLAGPATYSMLRETAVLASVSDVVVPVASREDLVAMMKSVGRPQDMQNAALLRAAVRG